MGNRFLKEAMKFTKKAQLSLCLDPSLDYCGECGNTNLETTGIDTWEKMYQEKYGTKFINK